MRITSIVLVAFLLFGQAASAQNAPSMLTGETTNAPYAWFLYCVEYLPICFTKKVAPATLLARGDMWQQLAQINIRVNRGIKPLSDLEHWGLPDRWNYGEDGYGDCDDYVLLKQRILLKAGYPRAALLITVVKNAAGEGHALLTVKTTEGDYVLDNLTDEIKLWSAAGYHYLKRQSERDPNTWLSLEVPQTNAHN